MYGGHYTAIAQCEDLSFSSSQQGATPTTATDTTPPLQSGPHTNSINSDNNSLFSLGRDLKSVAFESAEATLLDYGLGGLGLIGESLSSSGHKNSSNINNSSNSSSGGGGVGITGTGPLNTTIGSYLNNNNNNNNNNTTNNSIPLSGITTTTTTTTTNSNNNHGFPSTTSAVSLESAYRWYKFDDDYAVELTAQHGPIEPVIVSGKKELFDN
jgi:hypothetical protein